MSCTLNKLTTYNVGRVVHDNQAGTYTAQLVRPPASCPDTVFVSKQAKIKVVEGANPELIFDVAQNRPVIMVPRAEYVEQVGSTGFGFGFGTFLLVAAALMTAAYFIFRRSTPALAGDTGTGRSYGGPSYGATPSAPTPSAPVGGSGGGTTIVNNNSSNDGLLTGMMLGSMMSGGRSERVVERTTIIERDHETSRDSDDSDNSSSSSFSSDSDSDSSSSFSSDSSDSSSFSSDSGGSDFSSDSGGGSFSSDS